MSAAWEVRKGLARRHCNCLINGKWYISDFARKTSDDFLFFFNISRLTICMQNKAFNNRDIVYTTQS